MGKVSYDADQRKKAKAEGHYLFTIDVDGSPVKKGRITYAGPIPAEVADELKRYLTDLICRLEGQKGKLKRPRIAAGT